ncbi:hypothetical protein D7Z54_14535 [Salibacterium salarium]|uniref:Uncharacterized protein n=1 Tax=Salibacterium salarium TaxID=284579 RepID=A0A3R9QSW0_9BACI|nr:hypothetical protein [Salibacterium salarium]RSL32663.1 hypothetical protein D7Z54_14535 [Salibacterium salarium]
MPKHEVIKPFRDKNDPKKKRYAKGKTFEGDEKRIAELVEKGFVSPKPIEEQSQKKPPDESKTEDVKHVGGGYYELPNGEKVKGKEEALKAAKGEA